ncbi:MAG TPA: autotransporter-associated beta strand repeat-containing protein, partial [Hymenobacter sp.]|nr:autotransporter-associated beta strand repeat-containing protein [Hymenobacter sp.]
MRITGTGWGNLAVGEFSQATGASTRLVVNAPAPTGDSHLIQLAARNGFSRGVTLDAGNLQVNGANSLGLGALVVNGGTVQFTTAHTISNAVNLNADLVVMQGAGATLSGVISSSTPGTGLIVERIRATSPSNPFSTTGADLTLTGASTFDGPTIVRRGLSLSGTGGAGSTRLILSGTGSLLNSSRYEVGAESSLVITGTNSDGNRLSDSAPVRLAGGELVFRGNLSERVGAITASGYAAVTYGTGSETTQTWVAASELSRADRGTLLIRGSNLGVFPLNRMGLLVAPALVGGGGSGPARSILPWVVGGTSSTSEGAGLVTYDASNGIRLLTNSEYTTSLTNVSSAGNVRLNRSATLGAAVSVNSLVLDGASLDGGGTVEIRSGTLLATQASAISTKVSFGSAEGLLFTPARLTLHGSVSGSNGLTKSGNETLLLTGVNSFTGPLTVNAGSLAFTSVSSLGVSNSQILLGATTNSAGIVAGLQWAGSGMAHVDRNLVV